MDDLIKILGRLLAVLYGEGIISEDQKEMILGNITAEEYLERIDKGNDDD